jgi:hypothetical protein
MGGMAVLWTRFVATGVAVFLSFFEPQKTPNPASKSPRTQHMPITKILGIGVIPLIKCDINGTSIY